MSRRLRPGPSLKFPLCRALLRLSPNIEYIIIGSGIAKDLDSYCRKVALPLMALMTASLPLLAFIVLERLSPGALVEYLSLALAAASGLLLSIALSIGIPAFNYTSRADYLEAKFHVFASTLASLLAGGQNLSEALAGLAMYEDELKEFKVEINYIKLMTSLSQDPVVILNELSKITPSNSLRTLAESLAKGVSTGSDLLSIVSYQLETYTNYYYSLVDKVAASVGSLLEMFLSAGMIMPILVTIMGILFSVYPIHGVSFTSLVVLAIFILMPIISAVTVVLIDDQVSKIKL
ncbi:pilus assembly protein TadB [Acidilobus sp.]|uniref:pilus assembly protein TadB n=1 Tax=Acidilobus sp. TaxID=1872109 RepID=UPI003CFD057D